MTYRITNDHADFQAEFDNASDVVKFLKSNKKTATRVYEVEEDGTCTYDYFQTSAQFIKFSTPK